MRMSRLMTVIAISSGMLASIPSLSYANSQVSRIDADTIRVVEFNGKPPHKRLTISQDQNPALYAHYEAKLGYDPQPVFLSERRGAPGKSLPSKVLTVSAERPETAEFARFEESSSGARNDSRLWRGAPGKGRPLNK